MSDAPSTIVVADRDSSSIFVERNEAKVVVDHAKLSLLQAGFKGDKGDAGTGTASYLHHQSVAAATWTINHNLGFQPEIALVTTGGAVFDAAVNHASLNTAIVTLSQALAGTARCN